MPGRHARISRAAETGRRLSGREPATAARAESRTGLEDGSPARRGWCSVRAVLYADETPIPLNVRTGLAPSGGQTALCRRRPMTRVQSLAALAGLLLIPAVASSIPAQPRQAIDEERSLNKEPVAAVWKCCISYLHSIGRKDIAASLGAFQPDQIDRLVFQKKWGSWIATADRCWSVVADYHKMTLMLQGYVKTENDPTPYRFIYITVDMKQRVVAKYENVTPPASIHGFR